MIWYSCPSGRKYEKVCECGRAEMAGQQAVDQERQRTRRGHRGEQSQHQQHARGDLAAGAHVGQDVGVLVAGVGQRVLERAQPLAAPPAEQLLQPVGAQHHPEPDPQNQQTQMLGAAPPTARCRSSSSSASISVGSAAEVPRPPAAAGRRATAPAGRGGGRSTRRGHCAWLGVLVRDDGGGSEIARVPDRRQVIFGVDQAR